MYNVHFGAEQQPVINNYNKETPAQPTVQAQPVTVNNQQTQNKIGNTTGTLPVAQDTFTTQSETTPRTQNQNTPQRLPYFPMMQLQRQQNKKFDWDNFYRIAGLVVSVAIAILFAISVKPIMSTFGKKHASAGSLFENYTHDKSIITLSKLPGMEEAKTQFQQKVINPVKYKGIFEAEKREPNMACILYGEPGTGKTNFVKSAAKETDANVAVFALSQEGSAYMYQTSVNLKAKADAIISHANKNPDREYFVLFDEIESILSEASNLDSSSAISRQEVTKTFLQVMDLFKKYKNIKVFATTNMTLNPNTGVIGNMNPAAMSRFGTKIYIGNPDKGAIENALKLYLNEHPSARNFLKNKEDVSEIAEALEGASYRDITNIINDAIDEMIQLKIDTARMKKNPDTVKLTKEILVNSIIHFNNTNKRLNVEALERILERYRGNCPPNPFRELAEVITNIHPKNTLNGKKKPVNTPPAAAAAEKAPASNKPPQQPENLEVEKETLSTVQEAVNTPKDAADTVSQVLNTTENTTVTAEQIEKIKQKLDLLLNNKDDWMHKI